MSAADDRKVGNCVQRKQKRAGEMEKIPHHQVGCPGFFQLRKTVEDVQSILSFLFYQVMNIHCEGFKPVGEFHGNNTHTVHLLKNRRMLRKPDIDQFFSLPDNLLRESGGKQAEFLKRRHLPYHIISQTDRIQRDIHGRNAGVNSVKSCHTVSFYCFCFPDFVTGSNSLPENSQLPWHRRGRRQ